MPRSLVLGANGQDGSYLVEALLRRGHEVVGVGRDAVSRYMRPEPAFQYVSLDLGNPHELSDLLMSMSYDYAFHFAAIHGSSGFEYELSWAKMMAVNVLSLQSLLEHARLRARDLRIVFAGSSKIFPDPLSGIIDENTQARGTCLYSIGKIASRDLLTYYRRQYGISTTNLILFNHESPRRPSNFLLPTLVNALVAALSNPEHKTTIRSLDFWIDWGAADEFMDIVADIATKSEDPEFVLASGHTWNGGEAIKELFARSGLDASRHILPLQPVADPGPFFQVNINHLERAIGRKPTKSIFDIAQDIMSSRSMATSTKLCGER